MYVTETNYTDRFGGTAPDGFIRMEEIAVASIKNIAPQRMPFPTELTNFPTVIQTGITNGILETMYTFANDDELYDGLSPLNSGTGFTAGKYSEAGSGVLFNNTQTMRRLSPNAYLFLSNIGLFDQGVGCKHPIYDNTEYIGS